MKRVQYNRNPWTLEQGWSRFSRAAALTSRDEAPYLMRVVNGPSTGLGSAGRAVILDYGIRQADGTWKLASDPAVTYATAADIKALPHATGSGQGFNLRNYEVDLATLDGVRAGDAGGIGSGVANSTDDSRFRVELLTPAQFHFATSLGEAAQGSGDAKHRRKGGGGGIDFRPEMLGATYNNVTGQLSYTVNGVREAGRYVDQLDGVRAGDAGGIGSAVAGQPITVTYSDGSTGVSRVYESDVKTMIALLQRTRARPSGGRARAEAMEHRRAAAVNDNDAWRGATFTLEMVA